MEIIEQVVKGKRYYCVVHITEVTGDGVKDVDNLMDTELQAVKDELFAGIDKVLASGKTMEIRIVMDIVAPDADLS